jgi:hypothetical protein
MSSKGTRRPLKAVKNFRPERVKTTDKIDPDAARISFKPAFSMSKICVSSKRFRSDVASRKFHPKACRGGGRVAGSRRAGYDPQCFSDAIRRCFSDRVRDDRYLRSR